MAYAVPNFSFHVQISLEAEMRNYRLEVEHWKNPLILPTEDDISQNVVKIHWRTRLQRIQAQHMLSFAM